MNAAQPETDRTCQEAQPAPDSRPYWQTVFGDGWRLFIRNPVGRVGLILLGGFALMAAASYLPPLIDPMYRPMTGKRLTTVSR